MIHIRAAGAADAREMAALLNGIIRRGGTTAMTEEITLSEMKSWLADTPEAAAWHLAEDDAGTLLGFQAIEPDDRLPPEACDISTFVRVGQTGLGIGSRLFDQTTQAARRLGYRWINATIRADNAGGLAYYQSRGFEDYARQHNVTLDNELVVDKISKRYDL